MNNFFNRVKTVTTLNVVKNLDGMGMNKLRPIIFIKYILPINRIKALIERMSILGKLTTGCVIIGLLSISGCDYFDESIDETFDDIQSSDSDVESVETDAEESSERLFTNDANTDPVFNNTLLENTLANSQHEISAALNDALQGTATQGLPIFIGHGRESQSEEGKIVNQGITVAEGACQLNMNEAYPERQESMPSTDIDSVILADQRILSDEDAEPSEDDFCQYAKLNTLSFSPNMAWMESIVWQNIALVMSPELIFDDLGENAHQTVLEMLKDIENGDRDAKQLPLFLWIKTEFQKNNNGTAFIKLSSAQRRSKATPKLYYERYVVVDIKKHQALQLDDILLKPQSKSELLSVLQQSDKSWRTISNIHNVAEGHFNEGWPFHLAKQWYMTDVGLHFIYQPGEVISGAMPQVDSYNSHMIELFVPKTVMAQFIKPNYLVASNSANPEPDRITINRADLADDVITVTMIPIDIENSILQSNFEPN